MATLAPSTRFKAFYAGLPLAGGKLYTYQSGTTTPLATYTDQTGVTPNANPVILDANGEASVWLGPSAYKFVLTDSLGTVLQTTDKVYAPNSSLGASDIGADDGSSGSIFTTVQGFITKILSTAGSSIVGFIQSGIGATTQTVQDKLRRLVDVRDFGAVLDGVTDDIVALEKCRDAVGTTGTVWIPSGGVAGVSRPFYCPGAYRLDGDRATIKALPGFVGKTVNVAGGGTTVINSLLLFLLGDYNDIAGAQRENAFVGRGIKLDCNNLINRGLYIERMPYSTIKCRVDKVTAGESAIDVGPYCWGTHIDGPVIEDYAENGVSIGTGSNGVVITAPRIWGKSKTGVNGVRIKASANVNGTKINGGFIEKHAIGLLVERGNGPVSVDGVDFEVSTSNCVKVNGNPADAFKATVSLRNCYLDATSSKVYATSGVVTVEACRLRAGNDFETAAPGGFIEARANQYEAGTPTVVAGSNVAIDIEQAWTPTLLDDTLSPSEGQTYAVAKGTFTRQGDVVSFKGFIQLSSLGTLTGAQTARIGGLPFNSNSTANTQSPISIGLGTGLSIAAASALTGYVGVSVNYITLQKFSATSGTQNLLISEITAAGLLVFSGRYSV